MLNLMMTRHGFTTAGEVMLGGTLDVPLAPRGQEEAAALAARLQGQRIDRIVSSPMTRALETARIIAGDRPVESDERLREMRYGHWEGLNFDEIPRQDPELHSRWESDPADTHPPGGESGSEVASRVLGFLVDLLDSEGISESIGSSDGSAGPASGPAGGGETERRMLVVAHGTINRILLCVAMGVPVRDFRRRFVQDRGNLTVLRYERGDFADGAQLILSNDISHLRKPGEISWSIPIGLSSRK